MPKRKNIRECLKQLLNSSFIEEDQKVSGSMQVARGLFTSAKSGNVPAVKALIELTEEETANPSISKLYDALDSSCEDEGD